VVKNSTHRSGLILEKRQQSDGVIPVLMIDFLTNLIKLVRETLNSFQKAEASRASAGMTYYVLFSLSPLLIVMVTIASYFVTGSQASVQITRVMTAVIPVSQSLVEQNISRIMQVRNSIGAVGLIGFLWSASNAFSILVDNINRAWPETKKRSFVQKRLLGLVIVGIIIVLLILLMLASTTYNVLSQYEFMSFFEPNVPNLNPIPIIVNVVSWISPLLFFISLYLWVPNKKVPWKPAVWSAAFITLVWKGASLGFKWYLGSGLARYQFVYGSLSTIVVLLFWIYLSSMILFFGAHLCKTLSSA